MGSIFSGQGDCISFDYNYIRYTTEFCPYVGCVCWTWQWVVATSSNSILEVDASRQLGDPRDTPISFQRNDMTEQRSNASYVLGMTLNSSVVVLSITLHSCGAIVEMSTCQCCCNLRRCTAGFPFWSYPTYCAANLRAAPVGCILYHI